MNDFVTTLSNEWLRHVKKFGEKLEGSLKKLESKIKLDPNLLEELRDNFIAPLAVKYTEVTEIYSQNFKKYYSVSGKIRELVDNDTDLKNQELLKSLEENERMEVLNFNKDSKSIENTGLLIREISENVKIDLDYSIFQKRLVSVHFHERFNDSSLYVGNQKQDRIYGRIREGYGLLSEDNNQKIYFGSWKDNMRHGYGKQIYKNGTLFMGEWKEDEPQFGFLRNNIEDKLFYGSISDGIVCTKIEGRIEEMLLEKITPEEYHIIDPEGFPRFIVKSFIRISKFLSVKGIYSRSTRSINYDSGIFLLEKIEEKSRLKRLAKYIQDSETDHNTGFMMSTTVAPQQITPTEKFHFISLYRRLVPVKNFHMYSKEESYGTKSSMLRLLHLFNGNILICLTKFDSTLRSNVFDGPVCIITKDGEILNKVIKTTVLTKAKEMDFMKGGATTANLEEVIILNPTFEAEIFPLVFNPDKIDSIEFFKLRVCLDAITGKKGWKDINLIRESLGLNKRLGIKLKKADGDYMEKTGNIFNENFNVINPRDFTTLEFDSEYKVIEEIIEKHLIQKRDRFQSFFLEHRVINSDLSINSSILLEKRNKRFQRDPFKEEIVREILGRPTIEVQDFENKNPLEYRVHPLSTKKGVQGFSIPVKDVDFKIESSKNGMLEITRLVSEKKDIEMMSSKQYMIYTNFEMLNGLNDVKDDDLEEYSYSTYAGNIVEMKKIEELEYMIKSACNERYRIKPFMNDRKIENSKTVKIYNDLLFSWFGSKMLEEIKNQKDDQTKKMMLDEFEEILILISKLLTPIPLMYQKKKRLIGEHLIESKDNYEKVNIEEGINEEKIDDWKKKKLEWNAKNRGKSLNYLDPKYIIFVDREPHNLQKFYKKLIEVNYKNINKQKIEIAETITEKVIDLTGLHLLIFYFNGDEFEGFVYNIGNIYSNDCRYTFSRLTNGFQEFTYRVPIKAGIFFGNGEVIQEVISFSENKRTSEVKTTHTAFYSGYPMKYLNFEMEKNIDMVLGNVQIDVLSHLGCFGRMVLTDPRLLLAYSLKKIRTDARMDQRYIKFIADNIKTFELVLEESRENLVNLLEETTLEEAKLIHQNEDKFEYFDQVEDIIIIEDAEKEENRLIQAKKAIRDIVGEVENIDIRPDFDNRIESLDNRHDNEPLLDNNSGFELSYLNSEKLKKEGKNKTYNYNHIWIEVLDVESLSGFQKYKIVQTIEDNDLEAMRDVYEKFDEKGKCLDFLEIEDKSGKNLLMIAMNLGYRQCTLDLLTLMLRLAVNSNYNPSHSLSGFNFCLEIDAKLIKRIEAIILKKDQDGNNCIDLACIRGYLHEDELFYFESLEAESKMKNSQNRSHEIDWFVIQFLKDFQRENGIKIEKREIVSSFDMMKECSQFNNQDFGDPTESRQKNFLISYDPRQGPFNEKPQDVQARRMIHQDDPARRVHRISYDPRLDLQNNLFKGEKIDLDRIDSRTQNMLNNIADPLKEAHQMYKGPRLRYEIEYDLIRYNRELFTSRFLRGEILENQLERLKQANIDSEDVYFMTRRAVCLQTFFRFVKLFNKVTKISGENSVTNKILNPDEYKGVRNNPLHFTLHHADLHATIELLKNNNSILFWENPKGNTPPEDIKNAGDNKVKAKAILASILNEEIRLFNYEFMKDFLLENERICKYMDKDKKEQFKNKLNKDTVNSFNPNYVDLYRNDYVILHDELCEGYMDNVQRLARSQRGSDNISELEAMQRNFLDFHNNKDIYNDYKEKRQEFNLILRKVKSFLYWSALVFVEPQIKPEALLLLDIDPFEKFIDGRNMIHLLCVSGSHETLKSVLEIIHLRKYRDAGPRSTFKFKILMKESTEEGMNTPAHLCLINMKKPGCLLCLGVLKDFGIDIDKPNLRGRTVRELLDLVDPFIIPAESNVVKKEAISREIFKFLEFYLISACQFESFMTKYKIDNQDIDDANSLPDMKLIGRHFYQFRTEIVQTWRNYVQTKTDYSEHLAITKRRFLTFKHLNLKKIDLIKLMKELNIVDLLSELKEAESNPDLNWKIPQIENKIEISKELTPFIRISMDLENDNLISMESLMKGFFNVDFCLNFITSNGMSKYEKMRQIEFFDHINKKCDFSQPLSNNLDDLYTIDPILSIEILYKIPKGKKSQNKIFLNFHPVLDQLRNIQRKYYEYGGGIKLEALKGREIKKMKNFTLNLGCFKLSLPNIFSFFCKDKYESWFILISISNKLLLKKAEEMQLLTYNMKDKYHTPYYKGGIETGNLEPLRHSQKMKILMNILDEEFDIDKFQSEKLVETYFPTHDYKQVGMINTLWWRYFNHIHIKSAFGKSKQKFLRFMSFINLYHGTDQAFYFALLAYYNNAIFFLAILSTLAMICLILIPWIRDILAMFAPFFIGIWSTVFMTSWERQEDELNFVFGNQSEDEEIKKQREDFKAPVVIDEATQRLRKYKNSHVSKLINFVLTGILLVMRFTVALVIYKYNTKLLAVEWDDPWKFNPSKKSPFFKSLLDFNLELKPLVVKGAEPVVTLISNYIFAWIVSFLIKLENNQYNEDYRNSYISKTVPFDVFAALFTPVVNSFKLEKQGNLWSSTLIGLFFTVLTYSLNIVILPLLSYTTSRYYLFNYGCCCNCCWCKGEEGCGPGNSCKRRGKIEDFKEEIVVDMYTGKKTCLSFTKYCLGEEDLKKLGENRNIEELNRKIIKRKFGIKSLCMASDVKPINDTYNANDMMKIFAATKEFDTVRSEILKKQYSNFVMTKAQISETALKKSLSSQERQFYTFILIQFTWICLFSPIVWATPLLSYFLNYFAIWVTIVMYSKLSQRPISRTETSMKVWNDMYKVIGYVGIIYNAVYLIKIYDLKPLRSFYNQFQFDHIKGGYDQWEIYVIFWLENVLLVVKFILSLGIKIKSPWLKKRLIRENEMKKTVNLLKDKALTELIDDKIDSLKGQPNVDIATNPRYFIDPQSEKLRLFFKDNKRVVKIEDIVVKKEF